MPKIRCWMRPGSGLLRAVFLSGLGLVVACGEGAGALPVAAPGSLVTLTSSMQVMGHAKPDGVHVVVSVDRKGWQEPSRRRRLVVRTPDGKGVFETELSGPRFDEKAQSPGPWEFVVDSSTKKLSFVMQQFDEPDQWTASFTEDFAVDSTKDPAVSDMISDFVRQHYPDSPGMAAPGTK